MGFQLLEYYEIFDTVVLWESVLKRQDLPLQNVFLRKTDKLKLNQVVIELISLKGAL